MYILCIISRIFEQNRASHVNYLCFVKYRHQKINYLFYSVAIYLKNGKLGTSFTP